MDFLYGFMESSATGYRSILSVEKIGKVMMNNMGPVLILVEKNCLVRAWSRPAQYVKRPEIID